MKNKNALRATLVLLALIGFAPTVQAKGTVLKGQAINRNSVLAGSTGGCSCLVRWYTVGLRRGNFDAKVTLRSFGMSQGPTYAVSGFLLLGKKLLASGQAACLDKAPACGKSFHLRYRVRSQGAYYLQIRGEGAASIIYTLQIHGSVYPLISH